MARRYSNIMPINRIKHVVDFQTAVPVNVDLPQAIVITVDQPALTTSTQVATGSKINAFFFTVEIVATESNTGKTPNFYLYLAKNPGNNLTLLTGNGVGVDDNKRFVIHQEMVMVQGSAGDDGVPRNVFKGVIVVPKGMRRNGPKDRWVINLFAPSTSIATVACGEVHYKEFR